MAREFGDSSHGLIHFFAYDHHHPRRLRRPCTPTIMSRIVFLVPGEQTLSFSEEIMKIRPLFILCLLSTLFTLQTALAQEFPSKEVRLIVPFAPGGAVDTIARTLAPPLSQALKQKVIVENRPGNNTVIAADMVAHAPADGHTVLLMAPSFTVNPFIYKNLPYDTLSDFAGVTRIATNTLVISVHPSLPVHSLRDLIALARSQPGQITYATSGTLGALTLAAEMFKAAANINMAHLSYNGGAEARRAVLEGQASLLLINIAETVSLVASGKLRALAVTSLSRAKILPHVPTVAESGFPGFQAANWFGAVVRRPTPSDVVAHLNAEIGGALQMGQVKDKLEKLGLTPAPMSPGEFDAFLRVEMAKNGRITRALNVQPR